MGFKFKKLGKALLKGAVQTTLSSAAPGFSQAIRPPLTEKRCCRNLATVIARKHDLDKASKIDVYKAILSAVDAIENQIEEAVDAAWEDEDEDFGEPGDA